MDILIVTGGCLIMLCAMQYVRTGRLIYILGACCALCSIILMRFA